MAYRMCSLTLPRDSDPRQKIGNRVDRDALRPGEFLCFPGHIAMNLNGARIIHSAGDIDGLATNSLDPNADDYYEDLDESFEDARQII